MRNCPRSNTDNGKKLRGRKNDLKEICQSSISKPVGNLTFEDYLASMIIFN